MNSTLSLLKLQNLRFSNFSIWILFSSNIICFGQETIFKLNDKILDFQNYTTNAYILNEKMFRFLDSSEQFVDSVVLKKDINRINHSKKVPDNLYLFLLKLNFINEWDSLEGPKNKTTYMEETQKNLDIHILGKLKYSNSFNSYLLLLKNNFKKEHSFSYKVVLINIKKNRIISILKLYNYSNDGFSTEEMITKFQKNIFLLEDRTLSSDNVHNSKDKKQIVYYSKFKINDEGFVEFIN